MKKYTVNVHYDYMVSVEVEAENQEEALRLGREQADNMPLGKMEYCDYIDSCIADINTCDE